MTLGCVGFYAVDVYVIVVACESCFVIMDLIYIYSYIGGHRPYVSLYTDYK